MRRPDRPAPLSAWQSPLAGGLRKVPLQERSRAAVRRILDTASQLVEELGFEAVVDSPTLVLERSGVSRGSFYAFFETPERALDQLAYEHIVRSIADVRDALGKRKGDHWTEIVDLLVTSYVEDHRNPVIRELWVRQNLSRHIREIDRQAIAELATTLRQEFRTHEPLFPDLTELQCAVALHTLERLCQFAFTDDAAGDPAAIQEAHTMLTGYFEALVEGSGSRPQAARPKRRRR
jgi:AcrR family transcriptional regulator